MIKLKIFQSLIRIGDVRFFLSFLFFHELRSCSFRADFDIFHDDDE